MAIKMTKFATLKSLWSVYISERNEWFWNYKFSMFSALLGGFCLFFWVFLGEFSGFLLLFKCLEVVLLGHIVLSVQAVINDYVFDVVLKEFFKGLWLLISLRVVVEILVF